MKNPVYHAAYPIVNVLPSPDPTYEIRTVSIISERQRQIVMLTGAGKNTSEICGALGITPRMLSGERAIVRQLLKVQHDRFEFWCFQYVAKRDEELAKVNRDLALGA